MPIPYFWLKNFITRYLKIIYFSAVSINCGAIKNQNRNQNWFESEKERDAVGKKPHGAKNDLTSMKLTKAAEVPARHFISNVFDFLFISQFRLAGIFFHHKIETLSKPWISYFKSFGWFKFLILYT